MERIIKRRLQLAAFSFTMVGALIFVSTTIIPHQPGYDDLNQAEDKISQGKLGEGTVLLRAAIRKNKRLFPAYELLASAYLEQFQPSMALDTLAALRQLSPTQPGLATHFAEVYLVSDNVFLLRWAREAILEMPRSPRAHMLLAVGLARSSNGRDALFQARTAEQLSPSRVLSDSLQEDQSLIGNPPVLARHLVPLVIQAPYE